MSEKKIAYNPYLPCWEYVPDGEPHVFGDRVYVYGSHDKADGTTYCEEDYVCWSAPIDNLGDWKYEGISFHKTDDPDNSDGAKYMFAPDVAQGTDGRYYLYYFLCNENEIKVAVSDRPEGPFQYYGRVHNEDGTLLGGTTAFDPGVLCDASGAWLYYGFCFPKPSERIPEGDKKGGYCVRLKEDMVTICSEPVEVIPGSFRARGTEYEGHGFLEASSIRHIGEKYYLVYSSEQGHELCYAVSDRPDRGYRYGGVIISNADVGYQGNQNPVNYMANNHGGMVCIKGQWYIFYHRHTHKLQYSRQGCAEKIEILPDGKIPQVEVTSCGLNDGPLPAKTWHSAHIICGLQGPEGVLHISSHVKRRPSDPYLYEEDKKMYVANFSNGAECAVKYLKFDGDETKVKTEIRGNAKGILKIKIKEKGSGEITEAGAVEVNLEENRSLKTDLISEAQDYAKKKEWKMLQGDVKINAGTAAVYFRFEGTGSMEFGGFEFGKE